MSNWIRWMGLALFLAACGARIGDAPVPGATEPGQVRGPVYLDSHDLLMLESFPVQVRLHLTGNLPTPCHELLWAVTPPDEQSRIRIDLYTESDPGQACIQVLEAFDVSIPVGSFAEGDYTVWLNGEQVGEIALP
jgi:hypothetical protein